MHILDCEIAEELMDYQSMVRTPTVLHTFSNDVLRIRMRGPKL